MRSTDLAVIGAGPAGIGAALEAARLGALVTLIDEGEEPGGRLRWTGAPRSLPGVAENGETGVQIASRLAERLRASSAEFVPGAAAWGLFEDRVLGVVAGETAWRLQASAVIVASGSTDIVWPFPGWELPGVMTATACLRLIHLHRALPGRRVAVVGRGPCADEVKDDLQRHGARVVSRADVGNVVAGGRDMVGWVDVAGTRVEADCVVIALGRQPDPALAFQAQCDAAFSEIDGAFVPRRSDTLETSVSGVFVAGDAGGSCATAEAFAEGALAARAALGADGVSEALAALADAREATRAARGSGGGVNGDETMAIDSLAPRLRDDTLVCRCEEVSAAAIRQALAEGAMSANDLKRRTRAGMGLCQGIFCVRTMAAMLRAETGMSLAGIEPMTARPPARLVSLAALADLDT